MTGKITQISGSVIDVRFDAEHMPRIKEALSVTVDGHKRVMEVAQHIGNKEVRCKDREMGDTQKGPDFCTAASRRGNFRDRNQGHRPFGALRKGR